MVPWHQQFRSEDFAMTDALEHFHTRGLAATADLAQPAGTFADMSVLDVG